MVEFSVGGEGGGGNACFHQSAISAFLGTDLRFWGLEQTLKNCIILNREEPNCFYNFNHRQYERTIVNIQHKESEFIRREMSDIKVFL